MFPTIEFLLTLLKAAEKDSTFWPICDAITAGISNLLKWYQTLDTCHVYVVSNGCYMSTLAITPATTNVHWSMDRQHARPNATAKHANR